LDISVRVPEFLYQQWHNYSYATADGGQSAYLSRAGLKSKCAPANDIISITACRFHFKLLGMYN